MFYLFKHLNLLQQKINKTKEPKRSITTCNLGVAKNKKKIPFGLILGIFYGSLVLFIICCNQFKCLNK